MCTIPAHPPITITSEPKHPRSAPLIKTQRFLVTIHYREPTYQRHTHGNVARLFPYKARYEVHAHSKEAAMELAVHEFERTAAQASTGWVRQVVEITCEALPDEVVTFTMGEP